MKRKRGKRGDPGLIAVDLFAGAGGLSLGCERAGFRIVLAVESNPYSAQTYMMNRKNQDVDVIASDIHQVSHTQRLRSLGLKKGEVNLLLCGAPCQGFSIANMKTRSMSNPQNHLFEEFLRAVRELYPEWILFENVSGIVEFEDGSIVESIKSELSTLGYLCATSVLNAADFGVPQTRRRFFLVAYRCTATFSFPQPTHGRNGKHYVSVRDAISDLPWLKNGNRTDFLPYRHNGSRLSEYQKQMRRSWRKGYCANNVVTKNSDLVTRRYTFIPPGGNWEDIPGFLMKNYRNLRNCHSGIYRRLKYTEPSVVISNFRKCMLIHPSQKRGLSVREAARLQSFPDDYLFYGPLGYQQQQVADAAPALLVREIGRKIAECILAIEG